MGESSEPSQSIIPRLSVLGARQYTPQEDPLNVLELYIQSHLAMVWSNPCLVDLIGIDPYNSRLLDDISLAGWCANRHVQ